MVLINFTDMSTDKLKYYDLTPPTPTHVMWIMFTILCQLVLVSHDICLLPRNVVPNWAGRVHVHYQCAVCYDTLVIIIKIVSRLPFCWFVSNVIFNVPHWICKIMVVQQPFDSSWFLPSRITLSKYLQPLAVNTLQALPFQRCSKPKV